MGRLNPTCHIYPIKCPKMQKMPYGEKCVKIVK